MKKLVFILMSLIVSQVSVQAASDEAPRRDDGLFNIFYVEGAKLTPEFLAKENVVLASSLPQIGIPDSQVIMYSPASGVLGSTKDEIIPLLFPDAETFVLNGKPVSEEEFYAAAGQMLTFVSYVDKAIVGRTRNDVNDSNPYGDLVRQQYKGWRLENMNAVIPEQIVVNDPSTYPADALMFCDFIMTTPEAIAAMKPEDIKGYAVSLEGDIPCLNVFTDDRTIDSMGWGKSVSVSTFDVGDAPSVAAIAAYFKEDPAPIGMIKKKGNEFIIYGNPMKAFLYGN